MKRLCYTISTVAIMGMLTYAVSHALTFPDLLIFFFISWGALSIIQIGRRM